MNQQKIIEGIKCGDIVTAKYNGSHNDTAVTGRVTCNDAQKCVLDIGDGRNAIIFGDMKSEPARGFPGVTVKRVN